MMEDKSKFLDRLTDQEKQLDSSGKEGRKDEFLEKTVPFTCKLCELSEMVHYHGRKPKFVKNLVEFNEDAYLMIDPFSARETRFGNNFLQVGGDCSHCGAAVCMDCSIFYTRNEQYVLIKGDTKPKNSEGKSELFVL